MSRTAPGVARASTEAFAGSGGGEGLRGGRTAIVNLPAAMFRLNPGPTQHRDTISNRMKRLGTLPLDPAPRAEGCFPRRYVTSAMPATGLADRNAAGGFGSWQDPPPNSTLPDRICDGDVG